MDWPAEHDQRHQLEEVSALAGGLGGMSQTQLWQGGSGGGQRILMKFGYQPSQKIETFKQLTVIN